MGLFFVSLVFGKLAKTRLRTGPDRFQTVSDLCSIALNGAVATLGLTGYRYKSLYRINHKRIQ